MCLRWIDSNTEKPEARGFGYKVFDLARSGRLLPWMKSKLRRTAYEMGEWYEAYDFGVLPTQEYPLGFHIFTNKRSAENWWGRHLEGATVVRQVAWRHELARGYEESDSIIVAKEIRILPLKSDSTV